MLHCQRPECEALLADDHNGELWSAAPRRNAGGQEFFVCPSCHWEQPFVMQGTVRRLLKPLSPGTLEGRARASAV